MGLPRPTGKFPSNLDQEILSLRYLSLRTGPRETSPRDAAHPPLLSRTSLGGGSAAKPLARPEKCLDRGPVGDLPNSDPGTDRGLRRPPPSEGPSLPSAAGKPTHAFPGRLAP